MAELKTRQTTASVPAFLNAIEDPARRRACKTLSSMMSRATKSRPRMWGPSIVGFGDCRLVYASGRELDWFSVGFSPRKQALTLYLAIQGFAGHRDLLSRLGPHKTGKGCLYLKSLEDVDLKVLKALIEASVRDMRAFARTRKVRLRKK